QCSALLSVSPELFSKFHKELLEQKNLQAAIGAYYDFESPNINVPSMSFVEDVTIGEGESIPPDTQFTKTWRIQNTGTEAWPPGVCLKYVGGDQFGHVNMVMVRSLEPQEMADVSVQMCSPSTAGMYQGQWRMCTATGLYYGGEHCHFGQNTT
uniref:Inflammation and lipid regulator with UBA-like and NBR1-like domains n=1 Tax=Zosterops lateralis melanops TaxID=1220523 RepID=A0A8D2P2J1_ZOSLA